METQSIVQKIPEPADWSSPAHLAGYASALFAALTFRDQEDPEFFRRELPAVIVQWQKVVAACVPLYEALPPERQLEFGDAAGERSITAMAREFLGYEENNLPEYHIEGPDSHRSCFVLPHLPVSLPARLLVEQELAKMPTCPQEAAVFNPVEILFSSLLGTDPFSPESLTYFTNMREPGDQLLTARMVFCANCLNLVDSRLVARVRELADEVRDDPSAPGLAKTEAELMFLHAGFLLKTRMRHLPCGLDVQPTFRKSRREQDMPFRRLLEMEALQRWAARELALSR